MRLSSYDFKVIHKKGIKNPSDVLSRFSWEDNIPEQETTNQWSNRTDNQTFKQILRKFTERNNNNWDVAIWRTLMGMISTIHRSIGKTSAELVFGQKMIIPAIWNSQQLHGDNSTDRQEALRQLSGYRTSAYCLGLNTKQLDKLRYNKSVRVREFIARYLVLKALATLYSTLSNINVDPFEVTLKYKGKTYEITENINATDVYFDLIVKTKINNQELPRSQLLKVKQPLERGFIIGKGVGSFSHTATRRSHLSLEIHSRPTSNEPNMKEVDIFILEAEFKEENILERMHVGNNAARNVEEKTPTGWVKQPPNKFSGKWNEDADALKIGSQLVVIYSKWDSFILKNKALKTFVEFTKITQAMRKNTDEELKVKELLKKCSEQDRYRLLQMKVKEIKLIMEYFMEQEKTSRPMVKKKEQSQQKIKIKLSCNTTEAKKPGSKNCNICGKPGNFIIDCVEGMLNPGEMQTPERVARHVRKKPFSAENHAPDKKKVHEYSSPSRNMKQKTINLSEIPRYVEPKVASV
ncbi:hypothetical protein BB561_004457 [Smittium simulii]|uniref:CCHC-type domain-containing protein n=1 Tax=Smittium simulii TaxID=133385 RepID=A0A2T9YG64_9FUNG|nr:hypothetical protein BB561_004457 [Smittium simulii]